MPSMQCSLLAAWTTNRSLLVASCVKAFPGRPTNSDSTIPSTVHLDGGAIACNQCIHLACREMLRHLPTCDQPPGFVLHAYQPPPPSQPPIQPTTAKTNYTHTPTVTNSSADPNGSCLFAAGLPTDTVGRQNFQPFSTRQTPHHGD